MESQSNHWFVNIVSIAAGQSFFLASSDDITNWATKTLSAHFNGRSAAADRLWLRKEIIKQDATVNV